jgi:RPA family protein
MPAKRIPARKLAIKDVLSGAYVKGGDIEHQSGVQRDSGLVSRVDLLGTVVDKYESGKADYASIVLDDGTETIRVKGFDDAAGAVKLLAKGDICRVIGKVREDDRERFIAAEIVKRVEDPNYEVLRLLELRQKPGIIARVEKRLEPIKKEMEKIEEKVRPKKPEYKKLDAFVEDVGNV